MRKKLKIAQVSPLWYPVPPKGYGGTEFVVSKLTEGLTSRGHKVTLFASGNSKTKAKLVPVIKKNLYSLKVPWTGPNYNIQNLITAFSQEKNFDIIHTHIDQFDLLFRANSKTPTVATLHNMIWPRWNNDKNGEWHDLQALVKNYSSFPKLPYISISDKYRKLCPAKINFAKTIYHGVNEKQLSFIKQPKDYFVWLGRIVDIKGPHIAVKLARKMNFKLIIAGVIRSENDQKYFNEEIKPYLNEKIKFVGAVNTPKKKAKLLGMAKALIYPLLWDEPFGIVLTEALSCGTPVIAFDRGSAGEIVENNKTGFLVKNERQMAQAIKNIDNINRIECRESVEKYFTLEKMVENHENLYYQLIKNKL